MGIKIRLVQNAVLLTLAFMCIVFVCSADSDGSTAEFELTNVVKAQLPDFSPDIYNELEQNDIFIAGIGKVPTIKDQNMKRNWLNNLHKTKDNVRSQMGSYTQPNGPVVSYGYNYQGYLSVQFLEGTEVNESLINEIYDLFDKHSKSMGIEDVPVVFEFTPQIEFTSRTSKWDPLIGGVKVVSQTGGGSTSCIAVRDPSFGSTTKGFLVAGHSALNAGGIGASFYQPTISNDNKIGTVDRLEFDEADAAFIENDYINAISQIYYDDIDQLMDVTSYDEADVGDYVRMSGGESGLTNSFLVTNCRDVTYLGYPTLTDQYIALYPSQKGDSGSPIFMLDELMGSNF